METRELPIVAGHLALDFANTVDDPLGPARHDHLATPAELVRWAARVGLPVELEPSGAVLQEAHALRDVLNRVFGAVVDGTPPPWPELRPYAAEAVARSHLDEAHQLAWEPTPDGRFLLWPVTQAAQDLLTSAEVHRVKRCAGCPWLFVDRSRNGSRRWCAMNDCGTHAKIRKSVDRRAERRRSGLT